MYWFDGPTEKFQAKWSACLIIFRDNDERYSTELVVAFIECCSVLYLYQTWALNPSKIVVKEFNVSKVAGIKVRTQCFSAKCWKKKIFFLISLFVLKRSSHEIFSCFEILIESA